ncbi:DUF4260 family protein [Streptomyces sp. NPDC039016]|uniref:DUF4260 family protein n=1 Tax=Streptomyces sp. NPDC039016 TaxID=3154330 RepID=UPI0033FD6ECA
MTTWTWTWTAPAGRALSGTLGIAALLAGARIAGPRDKVLWTAALAPDTALLLGAAAAPTWRRLPRYAIGPYNALHSPAVPAALLTAAALTRHRPLLVAGLAWFGHLGWDRAWGYGPRDADGFVAGRGRGRERGA